MDKFKLEYELKKQGKTIDDLCQYLGIARSTYYRKIKNGDFTINEINKILEFIHTDSPMGIFFAEKVS